MIPMKVPLSIGNAFLPAAADDDDDGLEVVERVEVVDWTGTVVLGNMVDIATSIPRFLENQKKGIWSCIWQAYSTCSTFKEQTWRRWRLGEADAQLRHSDMSGRECSAMRLRLEDQCEQLHSIEASVKPYEVLDVHARKKIRCSEIARKGGANKPELFRGSSPTAASDAGIQWADR
ncbi:hypothetical protein BDZ45DRAFT_696712 [Acephala macrosclerotiorum]|nr:hypothetical protein BDZ45DRAFT_696712 [Acephala macrosclerotiorum]